MRRIIHLSSGFMITSMLGFLISVLFVAKVSFTWAVTFSIFFVLMFVASIVSMTFAPVRTDEEEHILAIHEQIHRNPPGHHKRKR